MPYSETRIVIGGLAHVPVIFVANFIKGNFGTKTEEVKDNVVKERKVEALKKLSNKLNSI